MAAAWSAGHVNTPEAHAHTARLAEAVAAAVAEGRIPDTSHPAPFAVADAARRAEAGRGGLAAGHAAEVGQLDGPEGM